MINKKIKEELKKKRISISELAKFLKFSYPYTNRLLNGKSTINQIDLLLKISDFLNVPITYWFSDNGLSSTQIGSNNQINGNNNKVEIQLKSDNEKLKEKIIKLENEIDNLKIQLRLKDELIKTKDDFIKTLLETQRQKTRK